MAYELRISDLSSDVCSSDLDGPRRPTIGEGQPVQLVEDAGRRRRGKPDYSENPEMRDAETRFQPARQRLIGEQRIEIHRRLGYANAVPLGRDGRVQVGQRLAIIEPGALRDRKRTRLNSRP